MGPLFLAIITPVVLVECILYRCAIAGKTDKTAVLPGFWQISKFYSNQKGWGADYANKITNYYWSCLA